MTESLETAAALAGHPAVGTTLLLLLLLALLLKRMWAGAGRRWSRVRSITFIRDPYGMTETRVKTGAEDQSPAPQPPEARVGPPDVPS